MNFETVAETHRSQITELRNRYLAGDREAIQVVLRETLQRSRYPTAFPRNIEAHYNPENRIALITLQLRDLQRIAILRDGKKIGQREKTQLHEDALYSIALRTLYEVVASDEINAIDSVAFNGWVAYRISQFQPPASLLESASMMTDYLRPCSRCYHGKALRCFQA